MTNKQYTCSYIYTYCVKVCIQCMTDCILNDSEDNKERGRQRDTERERNREKSRDVHQGRVRVRGVGCDHMEHREGRCYSHSQRRDHETGRTICVYTEGTVRMRGVHFWNRITAMKL